MAQISQLTAIALTFCLSFSALSFSAFAGNPETDSFIRNLREQFQRSKPPTKENLKVGRSFTWNCRNHSATGTQVTETCQPFHFADKSYYILNTKHSDFTRLEFTSETKPEESSQLRAWGRIDHQAAFFRFDDETKTLLVEVVQTDQPPQTGQSSESISVPEAAAISYMECTRINQECNIL